MFKTKGNNFPWTWVTVVLTSVCMQSKAIHADKFSIIHLMLQVYFLDIAVLVAKRLCSETTVILQNFGMTEKLRICYGQSFLTRKAQYEVYYLAITCIDS